MGTKEHLLLAGVRDPDRALHLSLLGMMIEDDRTQRHHHFNRSSFEIAPAMKRTIG